MSYRDYKTEEAERRRYDEHATNPAAYEKLEHRARGAGGTKGGIGEFLIGLAMTIAGGYLFMNQVTVTSSFWTLWGYNAFGLTLLPLLFGIGMLFFNGRSPLGWLLTCGGALIIVVGVIANLSVYWHSTSLFNTLIIFTLLAGGLGLVARSLKEH